jgi:hypothetical protein
VWNSGEPSFTEDNALKCCWISDEDLLVGGSQMNVDFTSGEDCLDRKRSEN